MALSCAHSLPQDQTFLNSVQLSFSPCISATLTEAFFLSSLPYTGQPLPVFNQLCRQAIALQVVWLGSVSKCVCSIQFNSFPVFCFRNGRQTSTLLHNFYSLTQWDSLDLGSFSVECFPSLPPAGRASSTPGLIYHCLGFRWWWCFLQLSAVESCVYFYHTQTYRLIRWKCHLVLPSHHFIQ